MVWQLQEAKQRFSELVRRALEGEAQVVTRRGEAVVVVVAAEEYRRMKGETPGFKEFLMSGPESAASSSTSAFSRSGRSGRA